MEEVFLNAGKPSHGRVAAPAPAVASPTAAPSNTRSAAPCRLVFCCCKLGVQIQKHKRCQMQGYEINPEGKSANRSFDFAAMRSVNSTCCCPFLTCQQSWFGMLSSRRTCSASIAADALQRSREVASLHCGLGIPGDFRSLQ